LGLVETTNHLIQEAIMANVNNDANRDPLTDEPGAHPVGVGVGAAGIGAAGAAIGSMAGPVGTAIGAAAGAVVGGLIGKEAAEAIDPTAEDAYWRENYKSRPYATDGYNYDEYRPAYQYGWESRAARPSQTWDQAESELERDWQHAKFKTRLGWDNAKHAARDAWERVDTHCATKSGDRCNG
jgi:phage tail tape-measure protein